jgi:hypothetical protein
MRHRASFPGKFSHGSSLASVCAFGVAAACALGACDSVVVDDTRSDNRGFPAKGVVRGTISYQGPRPCSQNGHVVGEAIVLMFDRKNPPPPGGLATTAVNFATVPGDVLFANEPRASGPDLYCPKDHGFGETITATAAFAVAPLEPGSYVVQSFYDVPGQFSPTFRFRNLPVSGDVGGGYLDAVDAAKHLGDPGYQPIFLPVDVGVPDPLPPGSAPDAIPTFSMPSQGFVRDGIGVTLGAVLPLSRPYFHAEGADAIDPNFSPIVTMTQDHHVLAQPKTLLPSYVKAFQASFRSLRLDWALPPAELAAGVAAPFDLQIPTKREGLTGGLVLWSAGVSIPETAGQATIVPQIWPLVVLAKLDDDDPSGLTPQGSATKPIVVIQGITLWNDDILATAVDSPDTTPGPGNVKDHFTTLVRPSVICFDPRAIDRGGVLVTPYFTGTSPDPSDPADKPLLDAKALVAAQKKLLREVRRGCLPTGKYGINVVYPSGQAWTVPNEMGACAPAEGDWDKTTNPSSCASKPRSVFASQGLRAVLQIVEPTTDEGKALCASGAPVPPECLQNP